MYFFILISPFVSFGVYKYMQYFFDLVKKISLKQKTSTKLGRKKIKNSLKAHVT